MKRILLSLLVVLWTIALYAQPQNSSRRITVYPKFKPAVITLMNGQVVTVPQANIFLKGSKLLYRNISRQVMEAKLSNIKTADFDDRHYERIDTMLAWRVDTVGKNALYCVTKIDMVSLHNNIINSRDMTNIDLSNDLLNITTLDVDRENIDYPLVNIFFYRYNGKIIPVHEREIIRRIPKKKLHNYKVVTSLATFSWTDSKSLLDLLKTISK